VDTLPNFVVWFRDGYRIRDVKIPATNIVEAAKAAAIEYKVDSYSKIVKIYKENY
jgi:hypothetical protein